jgi:flagellar biosynthetic protein FlhB
MAGKDERTEKPTGRKVREARKRGQVARSRDLAGALSLAGVTLGLGWLGVGMMSALTGRMAAGLGGLADRAHSGIEPSALATVLWADAGLVARVAGPPALVAGAVSMAASFAQIGWAYSPKALEWNWQKLNPSSGFARFAPMTASTELLKALLGVGVIAALCYILIRPAIASAPGLVAMMPDEAARAGWQQVWDLLWRVSLALVALAAADYGLQRYRWFTSLKMTRQEVRDESRMNEGNPELKARVRRIQRDMTRRRMLQSVKTATVVVTNPTHFAVALEYRRSEMAAPVVVAKGQDLMAARIREIARKHGVPIVENKTLARALYKDAEIGDAIPADLFGAVAEVLAYLVRLKQLML